MIPDTIRTEACREADQEYPEGCQCGHQFKYTRCLWCRHVYHLLLEWEDEIAECRMCNSGWPHDRCAWG